MEITFGKYKTIDAIKLLLVDPTYVAWVFSNTEATGSMGHLQRYYMEIFERYSLKKYTVNCLNCGSAADYLSFYSYDYNHPRPYCELCCEKQPDKCIFVDPSFESVWHYACKTGNNNKSYFKRIIRHHLNAKGMGQRITVKALKRFLNIE